MTPLTSVMTNDTARIDDVVVRFAERIREDIGRHVKSIVLFGSRARGDGDATSDYDFVIILDGDDGRLEDRIRDIEVEMLDGFDVLIGALVMSEQEWQRRSALPLGLNVAREGQAV